MSCLRSLVWSSQDSKHSYPDLSLILRKILKIAYLRSKWTQWEHTMGVAGFFIRGNGRAGNNESRKFHGRKNKLIIFSLSDSYFRYFGYYFIGFKHFQWVLYFILVSLILRITGKGEIIFPFCRGLCIRASSYLQETSDFRPDWFLNISVFCYALCIMPSEGSSCTSGSPSQIPG